MENGVANNTYNKSPQMTSSARAETVMENQQRLRPVYELLDGGHEEKVLAEADRLLRKNPACSGSKIVKALALIRMNRRDEARVVLQPVVAKQPTDDTTLDGLAACFRELDDPHSSCAIYEAACSKKQSEELLIQCFMAQIRAHDFKKQNLTALKLYKLYNRPVYFVWAMASAVLKFEAGDPSEPANQLSLQVAERMIEKFMTEHKLEKKDRNTVEESLVEIFYQILLLSEKWEKLIDAMHQDGYPFEFVTEQYHNFYITSLTKLGRLDDLLEFYKNVFLKDQDDYGWLKDIVQQFFKVKPEAVDAFLKDVRDTQPGYAIALGDLLFCYEENIPLTSTRAVEDMQMAILHGAEKPYFFIDTTSYYLKVMAQEGKTDVHRQLVAYLGDPSIPAYNNTDDVIRDVNFEMIEKILLQGNDFLQRVASTNRCFGKYLACEKITAAPGAEAATTTAKQSEIHDHFLSCAGSLLLLGYLCDSYSAEQQVVTKIIEKKGVWTSPQSPEYPREVKELYETLFGGFDENGIARDMKTLSLNDRETKLPCDEPMVLLTIAMVILEYGLQRSPHNYAFRVLLSQAYFRVGAAYQGCKVVRGLNIEEVQWDSLSYLLVHQSLCSGLYSEAANMFQAAENMYSGFRKQSIQHSTCLYKYGNFSKLQEFLLFRQLLMKSNQRGITFADKRLLKFATAICPSDIQKCIESVCKEMKEDVDCSTESSDNRNLTIIDFFGDRVNLDALKVCSNEMNNYYRRIRQSCLYALTGFIMISNDDTSAGHAERRNHLNFAQHLQMFGGLVAMWSQHYSDIQTRFQDTTFRGLWPPPYLNYFKLGCAAFVHELLVLGSKMASSSGFPNLEKVKQVLTKRATGLLKLLMGNVVDMLVNTSLLSYDEYFYKFHFVLETFSLVRIIIEAVIRIAKAKAGMTKSQEMSMSQAGSEGSDFKRSVSSLQQVLLRNMEELNSFLKNANVPRMKPGFDGLLAQKAVFNKLLKSSFLHVAFTECYSTMLANVTESYAVQIEEMRKLSAGLVDHVRSFEL